MVPTMTVILSPNLALKRPMGPGPCSCATAAATVGGPATLRSSACGCGTYSKISAMSALHCWQGCGFAACRSRFALGPEEARPALTGDVWQTPRDREAGRATCRRCAARARPGRSSRGAARVLPSAVAPGRCPGPPAGGLGLARRFCQFCHRLARAGFSPVSIPGSGDNSDGSDETVASVAFVSCACCD